MPYIPEEDRAASLVGQESAGELNYAITQICGWYLDKHGLNYRNINEVIGVLECAKLEMYRRIAAPYEDTKIATNGDVYPQGVLTKEK